MDDERLVKKVWGAEMEGVRGRGRPKRRWNWKDSIKDVLGDRGVSVVEAERMTADRRVWRGLVHSGTRTN